MKLQMQCGEWIVFMLTKKYVSTRIMMTTNYLPNAMATKEAHVEDSMCMFTLASRSRYKPQLL
jgi:hypothetical protein